MKRLEEEDAYSRIASLNEEVLDTLIRPSTLNYETAVRLIEYGVRENIDEVIQDYQQALTALEAGTTTEIEDYLFRLSGELQDYGIRATPDMLRATDLEELNYLYSRLGWYKEQGDNNGVNKTIVRIKKLLGIY